MVTLRRLWADERGATLIEYGIIAALVSVAGAASLGKLGVSASTLFGTIGTIIDIFGDAST